MNDFSHETLLTERLRARPLALADADALYAMRSDPEVQRYGSHAPWTDRQTAVERIERSMEAMLAGTHAEFAIERREDAAVVGTCTLYAIDRGCRRADLGYALLASAWGRGYASEAVVALLDWGFEALALNRVEADVDPRNAPSARLVERLGFLREGHLRERWIVAGEVCDSWMYGLLRREWRAVSPPSPGTATSPR